MNNEYVDRRDLVAIRLGTASLILSLSAILFFCTPVKEFDTDAVRPVAQFIIVVVLPVSALSLGVASTAIKYNHRACIGFFCSLLFVPLIAMLYF